VCDLTSIKVLNQAKSEPSLRKALGGGAVVSYVDILFLALVLIAFGGFAATMAYYAHR
jgi:hypothetical protein